MTNSLPFEDASSELAVVERVLEGRLPSLADYVDLSVIDELCSLMNQCWSFAPTGRPTAGYCQKSVNQMVREPRLKHD